MTAGIEASLLAIAIGAVLIFMLVLLWSLCQISAISRKRMRRIEAWMNRIDERLK